MFIADDGKQYPLSKKTVDELTASFGDSWKTMTSADAKAVAVGLMLKSQVKRLSKEERTKLSACDIIMNINSALKWFGDRDITDVYGPDATVDQLHGGRSSSVNCDCVITHVFDHHERDSNDKTLHPHFPEHVCEKHEHHFHENGKFHRDHLKSRKHFEAHYNAIVGK